MEFKRGLVRGFIYFHSLLNEEPTVQDAYARFGHLHSGREKSVILGIIGVLLAHPYRGNDKDQMMKRLELYIDSQLIDSFEEGIEYIDDRIECSLANVEPTKDIEGYGRQLSCQKTDSKCELPRFMKANRKRLEKLHEESLKGSLPPELQKLKRVYSTVLQDYNESKGNNCKTLGDTIISLECPKKAVLLTTDKMFETLGAILGKQVEKVSVTR